MSDNDNNQQHESWMQQPPKQVMQSVAQQTREYLNLVNRITEVIRLSDDISSKSLDFDITVDELMLTLVRRGEKLSQLVDMLHEYANRMDAD